MHEIADPDSSIVLRIKHFLDRLTWQVICLDFLVFLLEKILNKIMDVSISLEVLAGFLQGADHCRNVDRELICWILFAFLDEVLVQTARPSELVLWLLEMCPLLLVLVTRHCAMSNTHHVLHLFEAYALLQTFIILLFVWHLGLVFSVDLAVCIGIFHIRSRILGLTRGLCLVLHVVFLDLLAGAESSEIISVDLSILVDVELVLVSDELLVCLFFTGTESSQVIGIDLAIVIDVELVLITMELLGDLIGTTVEVKLSVVRFPGLLARLGEFLLLFIRNVTWNPGWNLWLILLLLLCLCGVGGCQILGVLRHLCVCFCD